MFVISFNKSFLYKPRLLPEIQSPNHRGSGMAAIPKPFQKRRLLKRTADKEKTSVKGFFPIKV